ncbi:MAG: phosphoglycerate mutase [Rhodanobacter sp.]
MTDGSTDACTVWLPALAHFAAGGALRASLTRADALPAGANGFAAGLAACFAGVPTPLPAAALIRQSVVGDAGDGPWLAADPAWARADINGIRLMACGHMQLDMAQAQALADPLQPLFAEAGMQLQVSTPDHWQLRLPEGVELPMLTSPQEAMGEDIAEHLPQGAAGKPWRLLLNDIQVALHQHPLNAARRARGLPPVNTLWFWGAGRMPGSVHSTLRGVVSDDLLLRALAGRTGIAPQARSPAAIAAATAGCLLDLQDLSAAEVEAQWWPQLAPLLAQQPVLLHFASGERWLRRPWHRWRVWRRSER